MSPKYLLFEICQLEQVNYNFKTMRFVHTPTLLERQLHKYNTMAPLANIGIISIGDMGLGIAKLLAAHNYQVLTNVTGRRYISILLLPNSLAAYPSHQRIPQLRLTSKQPIYRQTCHIRLDNSRPFRCRPRQSVRLHSLYFPAP